LEERCAEFKCPMSGFEPGCKLLPTDAPRIYLSEPNKGVGLVNIPPDRLVAIFQPFHIRFRDTAEIGTLLLESPQDPVEPDEPAGVGVTDDASGAVNKQFRNTRSGRRRRSGVRLVSGCCKQCSSVTCNVPLDFVRFDAFGQ